MAGKGSGPFFVESTLKQSTMPTVGFLIRRGWQDYLLENSTCPQRDHFKKGSFIFKLSIFTGFAGELRAVHVS